jgi:hypothetical protein
LKVTPNRAALKLLSPDQRKRFFSRRDDGLPQHLEVAERALARPQVPRL